MDRRRLVATPARSDDRAAGRTAEDLVGDLQGTAANGITVLTNGGMQAAGIGIVSSAPAPGSEPSAT